MFLAKMLTLRIILSTIFCHFMDGLVIMENGTKLVDGYGNVVDMFGWSIAMTQRHFACGILHRSGRGFRKVGSVSLYSRNGEELTWRSDIAPANGNTRVAFGNALALNEKYITVASEDENTVYMYNVKGTNVLKQMLVPTNGARMDKFGASVGISSDNVVVVGADKATGYKSRRDSGAAYVFAFNGFTWNQTHKLQPYDLTELAQFGHSVGITKNYIVVGAAGQSVNSIYQAGCVYVFHRTKPIKGEDVGSSINQTFVALTSSHPMLKERFGYSLGIEDHRIVVGTDKSEKVHVYVSRGQSWILETLLQPRDMTRDHGFGASVSIYKHTIVVGADECDGKVENAGCAYVYNLKNNQWNETNKLIAHDQKEHETFGITTVMSDGVAVIAKSRGYEIGDTGGPLIRGELYIFPIPNESTGRNGDGRRSDDPSEPYVLLLTILAPVLGIVVVVAVILLLRKNGKICGGRRRFSDEFVIMVTDLEEIT